MNCDCKKGCFHTTKLLPRDNKHIRTCCNCGIYHIEERTIEHQATRLNSLVPHGPFIRLPEYRYYEATP